MWLPELFNHSFPKIVAVSTVALTIVGEMILSIQAHIAEVTPNVQAPAGWEHITLLGAFGIAILWLLREREIDKKAHSDAINVILSDLKSERDQSKKFREDVISVNTEALNKTAEATDAQNEFFRTITQGAVQDAFRAGRSAEREFPTPKTSKQTPR